MIFIYLFTVSFRICPETNNNKTGHLIYILYFLRFSIPFIRHEHSNRLKLVYSFIQSHINIYLKVFKNPSPFSLFIFRFILFFNIPTRFLYLITLITMSVRIMFILTFFLIKIQNTKEFLNLIIMFCFCFCFCFTLSLACFHSTLILYSLKSTFYLL